MIFRFGNRPPSSKGRPPGHPAKHQHRSEHIASGLVEGSGSKAIAADSSPEIQLLPLCDLPRGVRAIIHEIQLASGAADQVMLFGFMTGVEIVSGPAGPGGDPRVYRLDGTEVAIRRATARRILVRIPSPEQA